MIQSALLSVVQFPTLLLPVLLKQLHHQNAHNKLIVSFLKSFQPLSIQAADILCGVIERMKEKLNFNCLALGLIHFVASELTNNIIGILTSNPSPDVFGGMNGYFLFWPPVTIIGDYQRSHSSQHSSSIFLCPFQELFQKHSKWPR